MARQQEIDHLKRKIKNQGQRLIALVSLGGIGSVITYFFKNKEFYYTSLRRLFRAASLLRVVFFI